jgi:hypothetical protein
MKIKPTQIFDWDSEPVDERPSEFLASDSFGASAFHRVAPASEYASVSASASDGVSAYRRVVKPPRLRLAGFLLSAVGFVGFSMLALSGLVNVLRI